jgi:hypothetical protein
VLSQVRAAHDTRSNENLMHGPAKISGPARCGMARGRTILTLLHAPPHTAGLPVERLASNVLPVPLKVMVSPTSSDANTNGKLSAGQGFEIFSAG